jgi:hypothetical protein
VEEEDDGKEAEERVEGKWGEVEVLAVTAMKM